MLAQQGCLEHALCEFDKLSKERKKCLCSCCCCSELVRSALYQLSATRTTAQTFFSFLTLCQNLLPLDLPPFCVLYVLMLDYRFISELGPGAKEGLKQIFTDKSEYVCHYPGSSLPSWTQCSNVWEMSLSLCWEPRCHWRLWTHPVWASINFHKMFPDIQQWILVRIYISFMESFVSEINFEIFLRKLHLSSFLKKIPKMIPETIDSVNKIYFLTQIHCWMSGNIL